MYFLYKTSRWRHNVSNVLKKLHFNKVLASYQLLTCKRVRFVCAAICLFSSSVGYGCWRRRGKKKSFNLTSRWLSMFTIQKWKRFMFPHAAKCWCVLTLQDYSGTLASGNITFSIFLFLCISTALYQLLFEGHQRPFLHDTLIYTASLSHHEMLEEPGAHDVGGVFGQDPPFVFGLLVFAVQQGRQVHVHLGWKDKGGKKEEQMVRFGDCCHRNKGRQQLPRNTSSSVTMVTEFK